MCKDNNGGIVVNLPDGISPEREGRTVCIDECIASQIQALWAEGVQTEGCCCGHGKQCPSVILPATNDPTDTAKAYWILRDFDSRRWAILQWKLVEVAIAPKREQPTEVSK